MHTGRTGEGTAAGSGSNVVPRLARYGSDSEAHRRHWRRRQEGGRQIVRADSGKWCPAIDTEAELLFATYYRHAEPVRNAQLEMQREIEDVDSMRKSLV